MVGSSIVETVEDLWVAWVTRIIEVLGGEDSWFLPILLFCPWKEALAEEILLVARSGTLALRATVGLGAQDQAHTQLPKHLCPGSTDVPLRYRSVQISCGTGVRGLLQ